MAINTLQYAVLYQKWLDEAMIADASTNWMEANAGQVVYVGGDTVKIPKLSMDGMGNYDKDNGYVQGAVSLTYETKQFTQDRGRKFQIDRVQSDDTDFMATAYNVIRQFQRTKVIPEIDAYRYATIATAAQAADGGIGSNYRSLAVTTSNILKELQNDIATVQDTVGEDYPLVISMPVAVGNLLANATDVTKFINVQEFQIGGPIKTKVSAINEVPILKAPSSRMYTAITLNDGVTAGQTIGGFTQASSAKKINWSITYRQAPIAVSKADTIRIFSPDVNQKANAWAFDYRRYHDIWIPDNRMAGVFVNVSV